MKVIIIGAGKIGFSMAQLLSGEDHDVVVIEQSPERQLILEDSLDIQVISGSGSSTSVLESAGVRSAELLVAVTEFDELNMVSCLLAKKYGVKTTVARVRNPEYLEVKDFSLQDLMGIDLIINPERVTAQEIVQIARNPEAINIDYFADGKVKLMELEIKTNSPVQGKTLKELDSSVPYNIVAIARRHKMIVPSGGDVLHAGDHIYLMARTTEMREVEKILGFHAPRVENVTILGGGRTAYFLAQMLEQVKPAISIKIIEKNPVRARKVSQKLKSSLVIHGDGSDYQLLEQENIAASDLFVAVTGDDKLNLLCSLIARNLGVRKTVCQLKRTDVVPLAEQLEIDTVLNPRMLTAGAIMKFTRMGDVISVTIKGDERAEILELLAQPGSPVINKEIRNIKFPSGSHIGVIVSKDRVIIPDGYSMIKPNDRILVFSMPQSIHKIERLFHTGGNRL